MNYDGAVIEYGHPSEVDAEPRETDAAFTLGGSSCETTIDDDGTIRTTCGDETRWSIPAVPITPRATLLHVDGSEMYAGEADTICHFHTPARPTCTKVTHTVDALFAVGHFIVAAAPHEGVFTVFDRNLGFKSVHTVTPASTATVDDHSITFASEAGIERFSVSSTGRVSPSTPSTPTFAVYDPASTTLNGYHASNGNPKRIFSRDIAALALKNAEGTCTVIPGPNTDPTGPLIFVALCHAEETTARLLAFRPDVPKGRLLARVRLPGLTAATLHTLVLSPPLAVTAPHFDGFFVAATYQDHSVKTRGRTALTTVAMPATVTAEGVKMGEPDVRRYSPAAPITAIAVADHGASGPLVGHHIGPSGFVVSSPGHISFVTESMLLTDFGVNPPHKARVGKNYILGDKPGASTAFKLEPLTFITGKTAVANTARLSIARAESVESFSVAAISPAMLSMVDAAPVDPAIRAVTPEDRVVMLAISVAMALAVVGTLVWSLL